MDAQCHLFPLSVSHHPHSEPHQAEFTLQSSEATRLLSCRQRYPKFFFFHVGSEVRQREKPRL